MVKLIRQGVYYMDGRIVKEAQAFYTSDKKEKAEKNTLSYAILKAHNIGDEENLRIRFDAIVSHDITYVGIIQTAKASGLKEFPIPYTLTNCHNSLCAVGGTINEDDHVFGLSAAKKYGGDYVPAHLAVIHQYMRECAAKCGAMILGSDSHTRYGALGTLAVGEGGPELVKQLLRQTYDVRRPEVIAVYLKGKLRKGVGPQDVALALIRATFASGFVKNRILEFIGPGIAGLSMDLPHRHRRHDDGDDLSFLCLGDGRQDARIPQGARQGRGLSRDEGRTARLLRRRRDHRPLARRADDRASLPSLQRLHHSGIPRRPDSASESGGGTGQKDQGRRLLYAHRQGQRRKVYVTQGIIAGCAGGGYENVAEAAEILRGKSVGTGEFSLSVYPASQPVYKALTDAGYTSVLMEAGAVVKTAFCGPCFGAGDVPANNGLSVRHTTRNFENREGSRPGQGQLAAVALMDARSIAATAANGGVLTSALDYAYNKRIKKYKFDSKIYENRVYRESASPILRKSLSTAPTSPTGPSRFRSENTF